MNNAERIAKAERDFRARLAAMGATPLFDRWEGVHSKYRVTCKNGHDCYPFASNVAKGRGICRFCAAKERADISKAKAESEFRERLASIGAIPLFGVWNGVHEPHHVRCVNGHDCYPHPSSVQQGRGVCRVCAGQDTLTAERDFRECLAAIGATPLFDKWEGSWKPHRIRCASNHVTSPRPGNVSNGQGACLNCSGKVWDIFYIVQDLSGNIKLGVTSHDYRPRLKNHKSDGYSVIVDTVMDLPDGEARRIELGCIRLLAEEGIKPIRGREYYPSNALPFVKIVLAYHLAHLGMENAA